MAIFTSWPPQTWRPCVRIGLQQQQRPWQKLTCIPTEVTERQQTKKVATMTSLNEILRTKRTQSSCNVGIRISLSGHLTVLKPLWAKHVLTVQKGSRISGQIPENFSSPSEPVAVSRLFLLASMLSSRRAKMNFSCGPRLLSSTHLFCCAVLAWFDYGTQHCSESEMTSVVS